MKEKDFEKEVKAFLHEQNCWTLKTWSNGVQREGVPDLLICCNGYFLAVELKAENGTPLKLQLWNIDKIRKSRGIALVLYPDQLEAFKKLVKQLQDDRHTAAQVSQHVFDIEGRR